MLLILFLINFILLGFLPPQQKKIIIDFKICIVLSFLTNLAISNYNLNFVNMYILFDFSNLKYTQIAQIINSHFFIYTIVLVLVFTLFVISSKIIADSTKPATHTNMNYFFILLITLFGLKDFYFYYSEPLLVLNNISFIHPLLIFWINSTVIWYIIINKWGSVYNINTNLKVWVFIIALMSIITIVLGTFWSSVDGSWGSWWVWDVSEVYALLPLSLTFYIFHTKNNTHLFRFSEHYFLINFFYFFILYHFFIKLSFIVNTHEFGETSFSKKNYPNLIKLTLVLVLTISEIIKSKTNAQSLLNLKNQRRYIGAMPSKQTTVKVTLILYFLIKTLTTNSGFFVLIFIPYAISTLNSTYNFRNIPIYPSHTFPILNVNFKDYSLLALHITVFALLFYLELNFNYNYFDYYVLRNPQKTAYLELQHIYSYYGKVTFFDTLSNLFPKSRLSVSFKSNSSFFYYVFSNFNYIKVITNQYTLTISKHYLMVNAVLNSTMILIFLITTSLFYYYKTRLLFTK